MNIIVKLVLVLSIVKSILVLGKTFVITINYE